MFESFPGPRENNIFWLGAVARLLDLISLEGVEPSFSVTKLNLNPVQDGEDDCEPAEVLHGVQSDSDVISGSVLFQFGQAFEQARF